MHGNVHRIRSRAGQLRGRVRTGGTDDQNVDRRFECAGCRDRLQGQRIENAEVMVGNNEHHVRSLRSG